MQPHISQQIRSVQRTIGLAETILGGLAVVLSSQDQGRAFATLAGNYFPISTQAACIHLLLGLGIFLLADERARFARGAWIIFSVVWASSSISFLLPCRTPAPEDVSPFMFALERFHCEVSPLSLTCFITASTLLMAQRFRAEALRLMGWAGLGIIFLNTLFVMGYIYGTPVLYGGPIRPVGAISSVASILLGGGLICAAGAGSFPLRLFIGESVSARLLRGIIPGTFAAIFAGELFADLMRRQAWSNPAVADAVQTLLISVSFCMVILYFARGIGKELEGANLARVEAEARLQKLNASLELKVEERTAELYASNQRLSREIEDRLRIEVALRESESRNRALVAALPDWIFRVDREGRVLDARPPQNRGDALAGRADAEERLKSKFSEFILQSIRNRNPGESTPIEFQLNSDSGREAYDIRLVQLSEGGDYLAIVRDISELIRLENELIETGAREQRRIGQDLHDGLGQQLTGVSFLTKALQETLKEKAPAEAEEAAEIGRHIMAAIAQIRSLARGLFQSEIRPEHFASALVELTSSVSRMFRVQCVLELPEDFQCPNRTVATHLYRIAQEAISNAVKHGNARKILLRLREDERSATLCVEDDGSGPPVNGTMGNGVGFRIMQFRSRRIGGRFDFTRNPTGGATITCTFPYSQR